jgi:hypothetical protein
MIHLANKAMDAFKLGFIETGSGVYAFPLKPD